MVDATVSDKPTHHCDYCSKDIIPDEREDEFGPTGDLRCPHCGAEGTAAEFGVNEPWVKPLKESA